MIFIAFKGKFNIIEDIFTSALPFSIISRYSLPQTFKGDDFCGLTRQPLSSWIIQTMPAVYHIWISNGGTVSWTEIWCKWVWARNGRDFIWTDRGDKRRAAVCSTIVPGVYYMLAYIKDLLLFLRVDLHILLDGFFLMEVAFLIRFIENVKKYWVKKVSTLLKLDCYLCETCICDFHRNFTFQIYHHFIIRYSTWC